MAGSYQHRDGCTGLKWGQLSSIWLFICAVDGWNGSLNGQGLVEPYWINCREEGSSDYGAVRHFFYIITFYLSLSPSLLFLLLQMVVPISIAAMSFLFYNGLPFFGLFSLLNFGMFVYFLTNKSCSLALSWNYCSHHCQKQHNRTHVKLREELRKENDHKSCLKSDYRDEKRRTLVFGDIWVGMTAHVVNFFDSNWKWNVYFVRTVISMCLCCIFLIGWNLVHWSLCFQQCQKVHKYSYFLYSSFKVLEVFFC